MPCRTPTAAQALRHVWITDDILADAFAHFCRVAHIHRRFGSNVPGPLEARRRLARRRMGMAAVASRSVAPSPDLGALFGLAARPLPSFETGWKWEGPMLGPPPPPPAQAERWQWPDLGSDGMPLEQEKVRRDERVSQFLDVPADPVATSKDAFAELLHARKDIMSIDRNDLEPMLDFLQSPANESEAKLTHRLAKWLVPRSMSAEALQSFTSVIQQKIILRTINTDELAHVTYALFKRNDAKIAIPAVVGPLHSLVPELVTNLLTEVTAQILRFSTTPAERQTNIDSWLACMQSCAFSQSMKAHSQDSVWHGIYSQLSRYLRPSSLAAHFSKLERQDLAVVLLDHWVPLFAGATGTRWPKPHHPLSAMESLRDDAGIHVLDHRSFRKIRMSTSTLKIIDLANVRTEFERFRRAAVTWQDEEGYRTKNAVIDLLAALAIHEIPYTALVSDLFAMWHQTEPPSRVRNLFWDLHDHTQVGIPPSLATSLIQSYMLSGHMKYAFQVFSLVPSVSLMQCFDLPLRLIEEGRTHGEKIFDILNRRVPEDTIAREERETLKQPLTQEHIDLVHLVAYAWACSPHITSRVAFRRVWECYRFLQDSGAPMSKLLSRAMVRSGIIRTLRDDLPLSKVKVKFIMTIVSKIEGPRVAEQADKMVFDIWKSAPQDRLKKAKSEIMADREAGLEMNKLRWKMNLWTRPREQRKGSHERNANGKPQEAQRRVESDREFHPIKIRGFLKGPPVTTV